MVRAKKPRHAVNQGGLRLSCARPRVEESMLFAGQCTTEGGPPVPPPLRWAKGGSASVANSFPSLFPGVASRVKLALYPVL